MMRSTRSSVVRFLSVSLILTVACSTAWAQGPRTEVNALSDGVLVDIERGMIYAMNSQLGIDAVDLRSGSKVWSSDVAAKPLLIADGVLIAQAQTRQAGRLDIVSFDVRNGRPGQLEARADLPTNIVARLHDTLDGSFRVRAHLQGDQVILSWLATKVGDGFTQGYLPSSTEYQAPALDASKSQIATADQRTASRQEGSAQLSLSSGQISPVTKMAAKPRALNVLTADKLRGAKGRLFSSADGRHGLASERVAGADIWQSYRWTIHAIDSGKRLGAISHHTSSAPFLVSGDRLIYVSQRYLRRAGDEILDEPRQLRIIDLTSGTQLWSLKVSEPDLQGPFPP